MEYAGIGLAVTAGLTAAGAVGYRIVRSVAQLSMYGKIYF